MAKQILKTRRQDEIQTNHRQINFDNSRMCNSNNNDLDKTDTCLVFFYFFTIASLLKKYIMSWCSLHKASFRLSEIILPINQIISHLDKEQSKILH